jgi:hypothetical protein
LGLEIFWGVDFFVRGVVRVYTYSATANNNLKSMLTASSELPYG